MQSAVKPKVVFIGAGNLATNLAISLFNAGCSILQVYSQSNNSAQHLSSKVKSIHTNSIANINQDADIYFICVPDKAIQTIVDQLCINKGIVVHTSGSTDISVLAKFQKNGYGVFYPFQTFSKNRIVPFDNIPISINANSEQTFIELSKIGSLVSKKIIQMNSETLSWLHLSGVLTNNFTNHLLAVSHQLSIEKGFSFELLKPLVLETVQKAFDGNPIDAQTGPAVRFDHDTINLHIKKLKEYSPELADIYKALTLSIQSLAEKKNLLLDD